MSDLFNTDPAWAGTRIILPEKIVFTLVALKDLLTLEEFSGLSKAMLEAADRWLAERGVAIVPRDPPPPRSEARANVVTVDFENKRRI